MQCGRVVHLLVGARATRHGRVVVVRWSSSGSAPVLAPSIPSRHRLAMASTLLIKVNLRIADGDVDAPRRLTIKAALGSEDRKGDVIDPSGWELDGYRRNPVFLWAHDRSLPPIGQARRIWVEDECLQAIVEFAPTEFADEIADLYVRGFMRGVSVGFIPLETELREASNGRRGYLYRRQELLEISAVPVPMHSDALALRSREAEPNDGNAAAEVSDVREGLRNLWEQVGRVVV